MVNFRSYLFLWPVSIYTLKFDRKWKERQKKTSPCVSEPSTCAPCAMLFYVFIGIWAITHCLHRVCFFLLLLYRLMSIKIYYSVEIGNNNSNVEIATFTNHNSNKYSQQRKWRWRWWWKWHNYAQRSYLLHYTYNENWG